MTLKEQAEKVLLPSLKLKACAYSVVGKNRV